MYDDSSLVNKLDSAVPAPLAEFDAFPKLLSDELHLSGVMAHNQSSHHSLGHGYASYEHVDHNQMNLLHVITAFSFRPHFPDITQPLDDSFESTDERFVAYRYFLHVVLATYIALQIYKVRDFS
ncbi:uncharacterized protein LACBIDRAFT_295853 [Laccaria bicolor S238N-H82]|uniref:Predicted protein n=1 Tax=Laccaria bicolor (strain S238N-H82 / ATCC MYA-4686) TaxID=486041 RepID=B0DZF4_LACBS|nr:uncharacterized protein LACBIDRAFT_295853 [Laccaria bicolor S238N-H82]EDR00006.1 predicted protein [Laccaria bicolor S238N-H82]|eukprot:XP_001889315.1 predicted protein [Laccaria bicolor S238N-H82]